MKSIYETYTDNKSRINIYEENLPALVNDYDQVVKNATFYSKFKSFIINDFGKRAKEKSIKALLIMYYLATDSSIPLRERLNILMTLINIVTLKHADGAMKYARDVDNSDFSDLVNYTVDFLDQYVTDEIKAKADDAYRDWFGQ